MMKKSAGLTALAVITLCSCAPGPITSEFIVESGRYVTTPFTLEKATIVSIDAKVVEGHAVNIYLMTNDQLEAFSGTRKQEGFTEGGIFNYQKELSGLSQVTCRKTTILPGGGYAIVISSIDKPGFIQEKVNASVKLIISFRKAKVGI